MLESLSGETRLYPILGDPIYGARDAVGDEAPLHLHARQIGLPLYPNRPPITVSAPPPLHMLEALYRCGYVAPTELPVPSDGGGEAARVRMGS